MSRIELGDSGLKYMKGSLGRGRSFGELLEENLGKRKGRVFTDLPQDVSAERAYLFDSAVLTRSGEKSARRLARFIVGKLKQPDVSLIVEDDMAERGDEWLTSHEEAPLYYGSRIYWVLRSGTRLTISTVEKFLSYGYSYSLIAAIAPGIGLSPGSDLRLSDLSEFATRASVVLVSAYDDTGHLYWISSQRDASTNGSAP